MQLTFSTIKENHYYIWPFVFKKKPTQVSGYDLHFTAEEADTELGDIFLCFFL